MVKWKAQAVEFTGCCGIAIGDTLPELPLIRPREHSSVLLGLMLKDRFEFQSKFVLTHGDQNIGFIQRPLLPRTTIEPNDGTLVCR